jgi:hypothetical protein
MPPISDTQSEITQVYWIIVGAVMAFCNYSYEGVRIGSSLSFSILSIRPDQTDQTDEHPALSLVAGSANAKAVMCHRLSFRPA